MKATARKAKQLWVQGGVRLGDLQQMVDLPAFAKKQPIIEASAKNAQIG